MRDKAFTLPIQIYYEDTDAGGVVYHSNYLSYMERARSACLREMGYPVSTLQSEHQLLFVVSKANVEYLLPAKLDDSVIVNIRINEMRAASMWVVQQVVRGDELLVEASIRLGMLNSDTFLPCKMPSYLRDSFMQLGIEYASE